MDPHSQADADADAAALLDALRAHPEWDARRRDEQLDRLIAGFPPDRLVATVRGRLSDLGGGDGEAIVRIVEACATPELLHELAEALTAQPDLPLERAWDALALLDDAGLLGGYPELAERWDELNEVLGEDERTTIDQLAEILEGDEEGIAVALDSLGAIEPAIRAEIIADLARAPLGPGLLEFLRLLSFAHDPAARAAALDVLASHPADAPGLAAVWAAVADDHPDPQVVARARRRLAASPEAPAIDLALALAQAATPASRLARSLVTDLDGAGGGCIVLASGHGPTRATASFWCDMSLGIRTIRGAKGVDESTPDEDFDRWPGLLGRNAIENDHGLALALLAGSLGLCGPDAPLSVRHWLEATVGPGFRPRPFPDPFPGWDPGSVPFEEMGERSRQVLDACPLWQDDSPLTAELAEEIALREGGSAPDPRRDAGAYRYLFEHRLQDQLESYRRRLFWMASFWRVAGEDELARSALALAWQLSDAQHVVPSHPFTIALATRSLAAAMRSRQ